MNTIYEDESPDGEARMAHYLSLETWDANLAAFMVAGVLPERYELMGTTVFPTWEGRLLLGKAADEHAQRGIDFMEQYLSQPNAAERAAPTVFIELAISKGFQIPWLAWALEKRLVKPIQRNETPDERRGRIKKRKQQLQTERVKNFLQVIAADEGCSESRIKQILQKSEARSDGMPEWMAGTSPKSRRR